MKYVNYDSLMEIYKAASAHAPENNETIGISGLIYADPDPHSIERGPAEAEHRTKMNGMTRESEHRSTFRDSAGQRWPKEAHVLLVYETALK